MGSVEEILMQQALQDAQNQPDPAVAMGVGASGGALLGAVAGTPMHMVGNGVNSVLGKKMAQGMTGRALRPGFRMAGGLVGAIVGGGLGAGMANMMRQSSPAGEMLAKIQARKGQLNTMEEMQLEQILADVYGSM